MLEIVELIFEGLVLLCGDFKAGDNFSVFVFVFFGGGQSLKLLLEGSVLFNFSLDSFLVAGVQEG